MMDQRICSTDALEPLSSSQKLDEPSIRLAKSPVDLPVQFDEKYCSEEYLKAVLENRFSFNGETFTFSEPIDWLSNPSQDREWHILLHKFYCVPGLARRFAETGDERYWTAMSTLIDSWISVTPVDFIAIDVTARRLQNWIYAWHLIEKSQPDVLDCAFAIRMRDSLELQAEHILENLAPARNHRTMELYAVFLMSRVFPQLSEALRWQRVSVQEMVANILHDLQDDGVHCEQSTDYHHIVLRSYLLFVRLCRAALIDLPASVHNRLQAALEFALHIHRPDGMIPALSDSDSHDYRYLLEWGDRLYERDDYAFVASAGEQGTAPAESCRVFADSGYSVLRSNWDADEPFVNARYLVFDAGPIGAGNHGHLDALSIEVAAYGQPLVVDPGRYTYHAMGDINWRVRFRETRAHNTLNIDSTDQALYRPGTARRKIHQPHPDIALIAANLNSTTPYLHGRIISPCYEAIHHRHIWFIDQCYWVVLDRIEAQQTHRYDLHWQLTPAALNRVHLYRAPGTATINSPGLTLLMAQATLSVSIDSAHVSVDYGVKHCAPRISATADGAETAFLTLLYPENGEPSDLQAFTVRSDTQFSIKDRKRTHRWQWMSASQDLVWTDGTSHTTLMSGGHCVHD